MTYRMHGASLFASISLVLLLLLPCATHAAQVVVVMTDSSFTPKTVTINAGDTVTWINEGSMAHTATADNGQFTSGSIAPGQQFTASFTQAGTYAYHCQFHGNSGGGGMAGSVVVNAAGSVPLGTPYPSTVTSNTQVQAQSQAQSLLTQVQLLQQQLATMQGVQRTVTTSTPAPTGSAGSCPLIGRTLKYGSSGDDVTRLQQFLAQDITVYPGGQATGYYGGLTQAAVQKWQTKFNIVSSGSPGTTGFGVVGPRTAAAIAIICSGGSINGVSGVASSPVGGFIQVTPIQGNAPLAVTVNATVNTTNSCTSATYTLDFGDGTIPQQIQTPPGVCTQLSQTFPHQYVYGGVYLIKLSAGGHQTTATVVVTGPGGGGSTVASNSDSITANTQSGPAPLAVTFTGIVNSGGACAAGTYTINFGDGQTAQVPYAASCQPFRYTVNHTFAAGTYTVVIANTANAQVGSVIITSNAPPYQYSAPTVTPAVGGNPLAVSIQFGLPTSCTAYTLSWGDGVSPTNQTNSSNCTQTPTITLNHTYAGSGTYTISLSRGDGGARTDQASIVIQNH